MTGAACWPGRPATIVQGRRRAQARIRAALALDGDAAPSGPWLVWAGGEWIEPEIPIETLVRIT